MSMDQTCLWLHHTGFMTAGASACGGDAKLRSRGLLPQPTASEMDAWLALTLPRLLPAIQLRKSLAPGGGCAFLSLSTQARRGRGLTGCGEHPQHAPYLASTHVNKCIKCDFACCLILGVRISTRLLWDARWKSFMVLQYSTGGLFIILLVMISYLMLTLIMRNCIPMSQLTPLHRIDMSSRELAIMSFLARQMAVLVCSTGWVTDSVNGFHSISSTSPSRLAPVKYRTVLAPSLGNRCRRAGRSQALRQPYARFWRAGSRKLPSH